jgi:hypothetical protein
MDAVGIGPRSVRLSRRRDVACNIYSCVGFYTTQKDKRLALFSCLGGLKFSSYASGTQDGKGCHGSTGGLNTQQVIEKALLPDTDMSRSSTVASKGTLIWLSTLSRRGFDVDFVFSGSGATLAGKDANASLPHDVQELLKSFFQSRREIENISKSVRDGIADTKVDTKVTELIANLHDVAKSTNQLQRATQESLHQSHVAIAVTEDVARMLHSAHTLLLPSQIEDAHQLATVRPPPLALARKLCAVQEKMKRITAGIAEANTLTENRDKAEQSVRPAAETFSDWTSNDINALLTDIENQYTLVQRMIAFLQSEVASLEDQQPFGMSANLQEPADGDLDVSFRDLRVSDAPYDGHNNTSAERAFSDHPAEEASHHSPIRRPPSLPTSPVLQPGVRFAVHCKVTRRSSAWDKLRATVKNSARPTYSLDLFEHVLECAEDQESNEDRTVSSKARLSGTFKQHGAAYRQLRSLDHHHDREEHNRKDVMLNESSPVKRQPFYVSADSPGDWRHIQPYVAPATTPGSGHVASTASGGDSAAVFPPPGYMSPLAGAMQHILKYVERQPKTPAPATTFTTSFAPSSHSTAKLPQSGSSVSSGLGFGNSAGASQEGGFGGTTLVPRRSRDSKPLEDTPVPGQRPPLTGGLGQRPRSGSSTTMEGHAGAVPPPPGGSPPGKLRIHTMMLAVHHRHLTRNSELWVANCDWVT